MGESTSDQHCGYEARVVLGRRRRTRRHVDQIFKRVPCSISESSMLSGTRSNSSLLRNKRVVDNVDARLAYMFESLLEN